MRTTGKAGCRLTAALGGQVQLVGDEIFVTNSDLLRRGIREQVGERHSHQAESDRNTDRDPGSH